MKNKLCFVSALLSVLVLAAGLFLLCSCTNEELQLKTEDPRAPLSETEEARNTLSETENDKTTLPSDEKDDESEFYKLIKNNPLDRDYEADDPGTTIYEMRLHQKKYTDLWLEELHFSSKSYAALLNASDRDRFLLYEEKWEKALLEEFKFIASIYSNTGYDLHPGSQYLLDRDIDYLRMIRERTLYVKNLQYNFEFARGKDATVTFLYGSPEASHPENKKEETENKKDKDDLKKPETSAPNAEATFEEDFFYDPDSKDESADAKNTIVTNQKDPSIKDMKVGSGNVGENGCGAVAIHNVKVIKGVESTLSETIRDIESGSGLIIDGYLGINPFVVDDVLKDYGINCTPVKAKELSDPGLYLIAFWNNPKDLGAGAHYVVLRVYEDSFEVLNGDQNGPEWYADKYIYGYRVN